MRHTVLCRPAGLQVSDSYRGQLPVVTIELQSGEAGLEWSENKQASTTFKVAIEQLVQRITGVEGGELQNITITTRPADDVMADPPLTEQARDKLVDTQTDTTITILGPIRFAEKRDRYEMWTLVNRTAGVGRSAPQLWATGKQRYIQRLLTDEVMTFFHAGPQRQVGEEETFKLFSGQVGSHREELWIRPHWEIGELLPEVFPAPKPPVSLIDPDQAKRNKDREDFVRLMRHSKRAMASQGLVYNQQRGSWGKPE